ncbi:hypothetical protein [Bizionia myxarmorum]|uniref:Tetratricopeptide repeat protein n=1 Tax=Bizionia myxarmorum TaxID=291186 RepID=A0A5D0R303_9FLAO|nr:hypothetical protein [Bizionia myxarmorum]TYB75902.1 hypothetical protein ES674_13895 [Bizionia myxarmorum]
MDKEKLLNHYFENSLSAEETLAFDNLRLTDSAFAEEVVFQRKLKMAITLEERALLKERLQKYESKKQPNLKWLYVAASFLLLIGLSFWYTNQGPNYDKLYASYFEVYPNLVDPVVRNGNDEKTVTTEAFIAYENGDFAKASQLFETISKNNPEEYALFYKAISLMKLNQLEQAAVIFANIPWSSSYKDHATWYLALVKVKQKDVSESKKLLESLSVNSLYTKEAKELLQKLD